ncbi:FAD dependent oxidoreductase [Pseudohyphozyma bogoriensis]|nr:FAD dependent oxidoreductase [Pseudohyphozyma bogoriensis]
MADLDQHARGLVATSSFPSLTRLFLPPDASLFFRYRDPNIFPHLFELTTFPRLGTFYIGEPSSEFSTAANYALENALEFTPARNLVVVKPNPTLTELDAYHVVLASALAWQPGLAGDMAIKLGLAPEEEEGWLTCARNVQPTKAVWDEEEWGTSEY